MDIRCLLCFVAKMALNQYELLVPLLPDHGLDQPLSQSGLGGDFPAPVLSHPDFIPSGLQAFPSFPGHKYLSRLISGKHLLLLGTKDTV